MDYHLTSSAIIAKKLAIWSKTVKNFRRKTKRILKKNKPTQKKFYPECGNCGKKKHPEERYRQGTGANLKPKRTRPENCSDNSPDSEAQKPHNKTTSTNSHSSSKKDDPKKLASRRLQHNDLVSVRQFARSDPPTKVFDDY